ncbi:YwqG family protein [Nostoc sp. ChiQUE01b]|uniref:YwqG family protein n=1 Tax=Nostoc sp. ChiQUE01b TaxID=3075376 RepID=UPI002AD21818|nr:YwqG family protein [Nostoc sp. ChiQUE01b]MDZ8261157.1 YwqG family protein [Nostoc sp. ChiQUE01b]
MNYKPYIPIPPELEPYRDRIEATIRPFIEITIENNDQVDWWQSKFGGLPYLPKGFDYPKSSEGDYLFFIAQINFAEVPLLEGFPNQGIVQFYISYEFPYGLNYKNQTDQSGFRVLYFEKPDLNIKNIIRNFDFLPKTETNIIDGCCSLNFTQKYAPISYSGINEIVANDYFDLLDTNEGIFDEYIKLSYSCRSKIGGYPDFVRTELIYTVHLEEKTTEFLRNAIEQDPEILLFQMASESNDVLSINWIYSVCNFRILKDDLKKLDFSDIIYDWEY